MNPTTNRIRLNLYKQDGYSRGRGGATVLTWWFVHATLFRWSPQPMYGFRRFLLRLFGAKLGTGVKVRPSASITYPWKVSIGDHSWIGDRAELYSLDRIEIGAHCVVSQRSYLCTGSHDMEDPAFSLVVKPIRIEDGAWVASDVFVYPGVTIGTMAVAAARSTVLRDIPAEQVHAGTPAKFLKWRFTPEEEKTAEEPVSKHEQRKAVVS
ncbi:colanic acid biosynthesis acetyltransferase WcaF [Cohnella sp. CFH 77786]|uniref:putative colanic acid biosynthesis acetyltransferase n=1 Tax=Cohnella sp. CFH 77786 TaxID=2662265 RepID=UPI001C609C6A|nr:putative colanic acid biosynthesis acetyltransferase [Cohnella sp. CFH 77786]MBW5448364.1 colanic acid biosynthesis acetyltransferase WcaF [Cohnella sp. CFH 77786]